MTTLYEKLNKYFDETFSWPGTNIYHRTKKGIGNEVIKSGFFKLKPHYEFSQQKHGELIVGPELAKKYLKKTTLAPWEQTFDEFIKRGIIMHVGSFSEERNNKHAIKEYGPDCLEFNVEYLKKLPIEYHALIGSVEYSPAKQNKIISTMFDLYEEQTDESEEQKRISLFLWLFIVFPLLKREEHHPDMECRIITVYGKEKNNPANTIGTLRDKITFSSKDVILLR